MDGSKFQKKKANTKQAWLDWLADDGPAPSAQAELRERFKQQANSYRPVDRTRSTSLQPGGQPTGVAPAAPKPSGQTPTASPTTQGQSPARTASSEAPPATVSIQIHLPSFQFKRLRAITGKLKEGTASTKHWFGQQMKAHKLRTLSIGVVVPLAVLLLFLPPLFNFGYGKPKTTSGSSAGVAGGSAVAYDKPPFEVVRPSTKPKLGTPDGVHAAYDGAKNTYSYTDTIGNNGFTVSQQPLPPQFSDGQTAVDTIAPTLNKGVSAEALKSLTGPAYVSTNPKYGSQTVVASVHNILIFIQSSHAFKASEWENYLDSLQ